MSELKPLITVQQLMSIWGAKESSIYDLLRRKVNPLPGYKIGASWRPRNGYRMSRVGESHD